MAEAKDNEAQEEFYWGDIDGVEIRFPVVVSDMRQATLTFTVPIAAARELIPGDGFEVLEVSPGCAMFVMALVDYVENPWGDYNEVNFGLMAYPVEDPSNVGAFVYRMPVDQEFTCKAGNQVLGLPKSVEELTFDYSGDEVSVNLEVGGEPTMRVRFPRIEATSAPSIAETITFSYLKGKPTAVPLTIELGSAVLDTSAVSIELGTSAVAEELGSLGLPMLPDMAVWGEGLKGTFLPPKAL